MKDSKKNPIFNLGDSDISKFLGKIEVKPSGSVVATIDSPQGGGKTNLAFQIIKEASKNYKILFISLEEHPKSDLFKNKIKKYIAPENLLNITTKGSLTAGNELEELKKLIPNFDVILIDSWNKVVQNNNKINFDKDLRKAFDGKLIFTIFQRNSKGGMRGGPSSEFDGDIIIKIEKFSDFKENYAYFDKNRYSDGVERKYSIYWEELIEV